MWLSGHRAGVAIKSSAQAIVIEKVGRLGPGQAAVGAVVSLLGTDAKAFILYGENAVSLYTVPIAVLAIVGVMISIAGASAAPAAVIVFAALGLQIWLADVQTSRVRNQSKARDALVKLTADVIKGIKTLKMYAWELPVLRLVMEKRQVHLKALASTGWMQSSGGIIAQCTPYIGILTVVSVAYLTNTPLDTSFMSILSLFNVLRTHAANYPVALRNKTAAVVAAERLQAFLALPEPTADDAPVRLAAAPAPVAVAPIVSKASAPESEQRDGGGRAATGADPTLASDSSSRADTIATAAGHVDAAAAAPTAMVDVSPPEVSAKGDSVTIAIKSTLESAPVATTEEGQAAAISTWRNRIGDESASLPAHDVLCAAQGAAFSWWPAKGNKAKPDAKLPSSSSKVHPATSEPTTAAAAPDGSKLALSSITFRVRRGEVLGVAGPSGSGKSSLLSAITGSLQRKAGAVLVRGSMAYTPQAPWVFPGTVRDNILFGRPMDAAWYARVLKVCCLESDLHRQTDGDLTVIAESGGTLSGGQQARVALARAVYANADVYLLDSPLAALDNALTDRVWRECIIGTLSALGKAVVITSQQADILARCTSVIGLNQDGQCGYYGPAAGLPGQFVGSREEEAHDSADPASLEEDGATDGDAAASAAAAAAGAKQAAEDRLQRQLQGQGMLRLTQAAHKHLGPSTKNVAELSGTEQADDTVDTPGNSATPATTAAGATIKSKPAATAAGKGVPLRVWVAYFNAAGGSLMAVLALLSVAASRGSRQLSDWYLTVLLSTARSGSEDIGQQVLPFYAATIASAIACLVIRAAVFKAVTLTASLHLHRSALVSVLRAPLSYFNTTPIGTLLARFTTDLNGLDTTVAQNLETTAESLSLVFSSLILLASVFPAFLPLIFILGCVVLFMNQMYRPASLGYKRLEQAQDGPLNSHVGLLIAGAPVIRTTLGAGGNEVATRFTMAGAAVLVDNCTSAHMAAYTLTRWLSIRLDLLVACLVFITAAFAVSSRAGAGGSGGSASVSPSVAALALVYALQLGGSLQFAINQWTLLNSNFISVERIEGLTHIEKEEEWTGRADADAHGDANAKTRAGSKNKKYAKTAARVSDCPYSGWDPSTWNQALIAASWPSRGDIRMQAVTARYRPDLPPAMKSVTVHFRSKSSTGIIGRSGSGKSTLSLVLMRLIEADKPQVAQGGGEAGHEGRILIDGVDISTLPLAQLRCSIGIVPQTPVVLGGITLAANLDPTGCSYTREQMATALAECGLTETVNGLSSGLDTIMAEAGSNLSLGAQQLVCFARVLLRKPRIILLDEATASLSRSSDLTVAQAILACSRASTILVVAHRLHTIMAAERILALDAGQVVEFDAPSSLLQLTAREEPRLFHPKEGVLAELVARSGVALSLELRGMAAAGYIRRRILMLMRRKREKRRPSIVEDAAVMAPAGPVAT